MDVGSRSLVTSRFYVSADLGVFNSNIWGPGRQTDLVESIASRYKFSPRLLTMMRATSPDTRTPEETPATGRSARQFHKNDIETTAKKLDIPDLSEVPVSLYSIASEMINYTTLDIGSHCKAFWLSRE